MAKAMKKRFAGGDLVKGTTNLRTRSDDEIGDTDRFGNYKPGSYAARQEQGQKSIDAVKGVWNRLTGGGDAKQPAQDDYAEALRKGDVMERRRLAQEEPAAPAMPAPAAPVVPPRTRMEAGPTVDEGMNKTIREAIGKRPTGMSPGSDVNQVAPEPAAPVSKAVTPQGNSQKKPEAKPLPPAKPLPNVKTQSLKNQAAYVSDKKDRAINEQISRRGPTAKELDSYSKEKDSKRKADYEKAQKEAQTPEEKAKRKAREEAEAVTPDADVLSLPVPNVGMVKKARDLAKALSKTKAAKSTAPYLKEIGNEKLKLGMKRGGVVKMASGGVVGNASKRADGIAQRGKTKCKTY